MCRGIYVFLMLILSFVSMGQSDQEIVRHHEFGFSLGGLNYTGDVSPNFRLSFLRPAGQAFYRYNFNDQASVLRGNILIGQLVAKESDLSNPLPAARQTNFNTTIIEIAGIYEYDFFNYRDLKNVFFMSPYLFGGLAGGIATESDPFIAIPFGIGCKLRIGDTPYNTGLEFGARKTFTDKIDGQSNDEAFSSSNRTDWYYFIGITLSRTSYNIICSGDTKKSTYGTK